MREVSEKEYFNSFIENSEFPDRTEEIHKKAYEIANENRKFEIENYWKRANYYWLFQASVYAGYFYSLTAENNEYFCNKNPEIIVGITFLGFLTAFAWYLTNKGSKQWQDNWENHVYELEKGITGPLYKTTCNNGTFSVSKVNTLVSLFSTVAWVLLGLKTVWSFWEYNVFAFLIYVLVLGLIVFVFLWFGKGLNSYKKPKFFRIGED